MSYSKYSNISTLNAASNEQLHLQLPRLLEHFTVIPLPGWFGMQVKNFMANSIQRASRMRRVKGYENKAKSEWKRRECEQQMHEGRQRDERVNTKLAPLI